MCLEKAQSTSQGSSNVLWTLMCLCILQVNYLFAQLSSTWDDSNVLKKSQRWCNKAAVSCIVLSEVVVSIKSSIFLRKTSDNSVPHELGAVFGAGESIITINSVYIPSIQKKELVNLYWEDFQSILRRQSPFPFLRNVIPPRSWVADQGPLRKI